VGCDGMTTGLLATVAGDGAIKDGAGVLVVAVVTAAFFEVPEF
jgi:hypothetical protein